LVSSEFGPEIGPPKKEKELGHKTEVIYVLKY